MRSLLVPLLTGLLIGSLMTWFFFPAAPVNRFAAEIERDIVAGPAMSVAEAESHRSDRYASIRTIEDTLALPTDFAETEALYVIAGRADSTEVQNLIYQAARIRSKADRDAALQILFLRLTELDPPSALAMAKSAAFRKNRSILREVWIAWGRIDLDSALDAARDGSSADKNLAAQHLYSSLRGLDNGKTKLIQSVLGARPGSSVVAQHLYALADESPLAAVSYIESLASLNEQREKFGWLASYLGRNGQADASAYTDLINSPNNRQAFKQSLESFSARSDPEAALEKMLAGNLGPREYGQVQMALHQLAEQDPDKAIEYLARFPNSAMRPGMISIIGAAIAKSDPDRALTWARENDPSGTQGLFAGIVAQLAQFDPQRAITEAAAIADPQQRQQALSGVLFTAAQNNPADAAQFLELISDAGTRRSGIQQIASTWAQQDVDAAIAWAGTLETRERRSAIVQIGQQLVHTDLDRAMEFVGKVPAGGAARQLKQQIAMNLAQQRSVDDAQAFIDQFRGTDEYTKLQVAVISSAVATDPARARRMARSVQDDNARDQIYATIVGREAATDPRKALRSLDEIRSGTARSSAITQIAYNWVSKDPAAAETWVRSLPGGQDRDSAVVAIVSARSDTSSSARELIDSVGDATKRKQAMLGHIRRLAHDDPAEARRQLNEIDLTEAERQQYQMMLDNMDGFSFGMGRIGVN